jgi:undecaprenyl-diphosphatase
MVILQALILGIVQGLTEFIPISSSAHLIIVPWLFVWNDAVLTSLSFDVSLHLGTLLALLTYFSADWLRLIKAFFASLVERRIGDDLDRRLAWFLLAGSIPGMVAGFLAESEIEKLFHAPNTVPGFIALATMAAIIAVMALAMFLVERLVRHTRTLQNISLKDSLLIGLAQALAIFPGVSRSGATITAGLALGLERAAAARFSFLLSAPIIAGAGLKTLWDLFQGNQGGNGYAATEWTLFVIGILSASVSGYLSIKYLLRYLQKNSIDIFAYYRWGLAIVIFVIALMRG